jgi:arylsulfatase A-like enzyme
VLDETHLTLAESLQQGGYRTVGIVNQIYLQWKFGFGQGFDRYQGLRGFDGVRINRRLERELAELRASPPDAAGGEGDEPLFLYLHYLDPHWPYNHRVDDPAPPSLAAADDDPGLPRSPEEATAWVSELDDEGLRRRAVETLAARYALEVRWVDTVLGGLVDLLERHGLWENTILVVTSDHGEGFWEHQRLLHGHAPYEEQVRVPLLVRTPAALGLAPGRRTAPVGLIDLMPTLLDLAGLPIPEPCRGRSLLPALRGEEDGERALLVDTGNERALRTRDAKLLVRRGAGEDGAPSVEFYDLAADPGERRNLATPCAGPCRDSARRLQEIERGLARPAGAADGAGDVTADEIEELRSLGYVGE